MVVALRDVHVRVTRSARLLEELQPVPVARLVRVDLRRDDRKLEGNADPRDRRLDEVAIGVREERELPAARACLFEGRANLRKGTPTRAELPRAHPPHPSVRRAPPLPRSSPPDSFARRRPAASARARGSARAARRRVPRRRPARARGGCRRSSRSACRSNRTSPTALWTYGDEPSLRRASGRSTRCDRRNRTSSTRRHARPHRASRSGCNRGRTPDPRPRS